MKRSVQIAGAGLAGLAAAIRLAQLGWRVTLHERSADLRMFGAGIWLWESGLKTLSILGAFEQATQRARIIREWRIADHDGKVMITRPMTGDDRLLLPPRADLYQALIDRAVALGVETRTSSVVTAVRPEGVLVTEDGHEHRGDLVLIANGAQSQLRESILGTAWIDYGIEAGIRMLIDSQPGDPTEIVTEYWRGPWRLLFNPCTEGQNYICLAAPVSDDRARRMPVDRELWKGHFPVAADLIDRFAEDSRWDRLMNVKCRRWCLGHVAIIGDAAHAMPPNLGQAANTAFINVMALARDVSDAADIPSALQSWEARQRPVTNHVQWWSYGYGFVVGKWPQSLLGLRNDFLRAIANSSWLDDGIGRGARHVPDGYHAAISRHSVGVP